MTAERLAFDRAGGQLVPESCRCKHTYADHWPDGRWCAEDDCACSAYVAASR